MSDERFERDIRDALLADDPGAVPGRLWTRIAAIPDEAPRRTSRPVRLLGLLAAAAVVIVAVAVAGLSQRGPTVGPPASASPPVAVPSPSAPATVVSPSAAPSSSPSSSSPSAAPSAAPGANDPTGPIAVAPADIQALPAGVFAIRDGKAYTLNAGPARLGAPAVIASVDVASGAVTTLASLPAGHTADTMALAADDLVWMESWYAKPPINCGGATPCNPYAGQPVLWKVVAMPIAGGSARELANGTSSRTSIEGEGAAPQAPVLAAYGDRVAYAEDAPTKSAPEGSTIVVRSISTGAILRRVDTEGYIELLGLSGTVLAYGEAFDTAGPGSIAWGDSTLMVARTNDETPAKVDEHASSLAVGGGRIAWIRADATDYTAWTAPLDTLQPSKVAGPAIDVPPGQVGLSFGVVIAGDGIAWAVQVPDTTGAFSTGVALWRPGEPRARLLTGIAPDTTLISGDGLLAWNRPDGSANPEEAIPLAKLWGSN